MRPHNQKFLENDSYNYRKKQNHSFSKNSKEKRNISPCLINKQNYSFSNQTIPFNNNDSYSYNYSRGNNELPTNNSRLENPLIFEMLLKQKRKLQEELDDEKMQNRKISMHLSELENRNMGLEKINCNNASFENEQNQKYRNIKQKLHIMKEKKQELENETVTFTNQINEQNISLYKLQNENQEIRKRYMSKSKEFDKLYRDFCKMKEESDLGALKNNAENEKLNLALKETEKKLFKEKEINKNLESYNSKLFEENEILMQEKQAAKSLVNEIEKEIKERSQKNEHLSKELEFTKSKLGKKKEKIKKFKEIILDCQNQLEKNKFDMIEIEEKNINLAEFIRKEIQNRPLDFDVSPPTFKQHGINYIQNSNNMNKSFENLRFSEFPIKDKVNNAKMFDSNSLIIEPKLKYKKYGEESHTQFNLLSVKEKLSNIKSKKTLLEKKLKMVETQIEK